MKSVVALSVLLALSTSPITQGRDNSQAVQNSLVIDRCVELASVKFRIHSDLLRAILLTEGGGAGARNKNTSNGTYDYGHGQINDVNVPELESHGVTKDALRHDPCTNIGSAAWLLSKHLIRAGQWGVENPNPEKFWKAVGNYHSKTKKYNDIYQRKVWENLQIIQMARMTTQ
ncbi:lytic transglycosylase domain-containing protein [Aeromonas veronii]|uniref:Lytic transglycosylase domain-containing protein n=1 Tax=Aeromonas veronii TaxID=654 RepID=A0A4S5CCY0_AERVE|nr:lytic transglycosylase domain-containing protein [Aeromonas veronii]THJ43647.1 lytic transglycosylase domain-containing protein [Aeromonas veronii]